MKITEFSVDRAKVFLSREPSSGRRVWCARAIVRSDKGAIQEAITLLRRLG